ncbi:hypothetical protein PTNB73_05328 [Pyrenophora teres f. teres]|nr:hypothetical protein HRS9139_05100 [Pyrenophora teres f. teres]KAE8864445.1 hypothetical protein PTNB29_04409 [Pyrenophora teres f. teres]KAE8867234.1 hypothetical protein PTNB73_05328 [Pyrenophora teres f. teres]
MATMYALATMPRTPSPKVRIRSQSFDSPGSGGSRSSITPIEHYSPFSKSTGAIKTLTSYEAIKAVAEKVMRPLGVMLSPLNTKMSDDEEEEEEEEESDIESSSSSNSSPSSSPTTTSFHSAVPSSRVSTSSASRRSNRRSHPLAETHSVSDTVEFEPTSPFLYQDTSFAMYSPWLVRVVLDMYDVRGLCWMDIADPIERVWGVQTSSAEVLGILSDNGRVGVRRWWD